ncbi:32791_t:CDS:2 [Gigaspora margarita]|uniref:32791_t:CDS:1 n=1 Tax=Gigaspora margarita TaxID=4874 RepID=A0ABN7UIM8_GIGMA|nr:32791_t:CDS:2 [Gigaspora margarita]
MKSSEKELQLTPTMKSPEKELQLTPMMKSYLKKKYNNEKNSKMTPI